MALTHHFTRRHERQTAEEKRQEERLFIGIELVTVLEHFALCCADVAHDRGKRETDPLTGASRLVPAMSEPVVDYSALTGEWKVLPTVLMYHLRELPLSVRQTAQLLARYHALNDPYHIRYFSYRRWHYARAGLRAILLSAKLRGLCSLPASRLTTSPDSSWHQLRRARQAERRFYISSRPSILP
ncbi:hypothetical protein [Pantoea coffeiphila]|uniref:hypothetical protein n=1 Tax=Pantoea coffeiphila TaxID=1465635 RepID=UPI00195F42C6|nr:hypothetical protein [Pantoea coffeiphila]MBM7345048.1 hypothetical protein [Pantoea coffeiphila]